MAPKAAAVAVVLESTDNFRQATRACVSEPTFLGLGSAFGGRGHPDASRAVLVLLWVKVPRRQCCQLHGWDLRSASV